MRAKRLTPGETIGIISPSHVADVVRYKVITTTLGKMGFDVVLGENISKNTYGYGASVEERAKDLNNMVANKRVKMILFGGGEGAVELLPLIDYDNIACNPKIFSSYSDGTSILNAIYAQTGLITYYGAGTGQFADLRYYDYRQFCSHFVQGYSAREFFSNSNWKTLGGGSFEGILIGGYASLVGLMLSNKYFHYNIDKKYLLFLEDHESLSEVGTVSTYLSFIEQSSFMKNVGGLIFGHFAVNVPDDLLHCLERFGVKNNIPVVYTDDFGHGVNHGIFPIGGSAKLNADKQTLCFTDLEK